MNAVMIDTLAAKASAALTESKSLELVKPTYGFINTTDIVRTFHSRGWELSDAKQMRVNKAERQGFQKHLLRFRHDKITRIEGLSNENESIPELIVENSHDGTSALRIFFGVFRIACLNGLIAGNSLHEMRVIHSQRSVKALGGAVEEMTDNVPQLVSSVKKYSQIELSTDKMHDLARQAIELRLRHTQNVIDFKIDAALQPTRHTDYGNDAYTVFNILQEKVIRGGIKYTQKLENGWDQRKTTRPISAVTQTTKLNRELWNILEKVAG